MYILTTYARSEDVDNRRHITQHKTILIKQQQQQNRKPKFTSVYLLKSLGSKSYQKDAKESLRDLMILVDIPLENEPITRFRKDSGL